MLLLMRQSHRVSGCLGGIRLSAYGKVDATRQASKDLNKNPQSSEYHLEEPDDRHVVVSDQRLGLGDLGQGVDGRAGALLQPGDDVVRLSAGCSTTTTTAQAPMRTKTHRTLNFK